MGTITLYYVPGHNTKIITMPFCQVVKDSCNQLPTVDSYQYTVPFNNIEYKWTTCKPKWNQPLPPNRKPEKNVCVQCSPVLGSPWLLPKALPGLFLCIYSAPSHPQETCFQQAGSCAVEGTSQAVLGSSDQLKVPASLSLFLKSEKSQLSPCVLLWPEYRPFREFRPSIWEGQIGKEESLLAWAFWRGEDLYINDTKVTPQH